VTDRRGENRFPLVPLLVLLSALEHGSCPARQLDDAPSGFRLRLSSMIKPFPLIRMTVPRTSTVPASRSSDGQVMAEVSPIRRPVATIMSTSSTKSQSMAF
jgi:hypothetical protein